VRLVDKQPGGAVVSFFIPIDRYAFKYPKTNEPETMYVFDKKITFVLLNK